jgi:DnaK suppressor protein
MPSRPGGRRLGPEQAAHGSRNCVLNPPSHLRLSAPGPPGMTERTDHVTSTVQEPAEVFRDLLEEQFERHTRQLSELIMYAQQPDRGGYDEETLIALTVSSRRALADTATALRRMAEGTYGTCQRCALSISLDRLQAVPHTPFCLSCQRTRTG